MQAPHKQQHTTKQRPVQPRQESNEHTQKTNKLWYNLRLKIQGVTPTQLSQTVIGRGKHLQGPPRRSQPGVTGKWDSANHFLWWRISKRPRHHPHRTLPQGLYCHICSHPHIEEPQHAKGYVTNIPAFGPSIRMHYAATFAFVLTSPPPPPPQTGGDIQFSRPTI